MSSGNDYSHNYAFIFYDIGEKRVNKVFKVCKKYFKHHQKSVFRGHVTPANLIKLKAELEKIIDKKEDYVTIIKLTSNAYFDEETLGHKGKASSEALII